MTRMALPYSSGNGLEITDKCRDRQRGTLLGLAIGDALGAAVEFQPPGTFDKVTDYRAGGPHGLKPGEWTDDTSMALAMADSIAEAGWDLNDQARRYVEWWRTGAYSVRRGIIVHREKVEKVPSGFDQEEDTCGSS